MERHTPLIGPIWVAALVLVCSWPVVTGIVNSWFDGAANTEHGMLVPFTVAYLVYLRKDEVAAAPKERNGWGLLLMLLAAGLMWISLVARWVFLSRASVLASIVGAVWFLYGSRVLKLLRFPLAISLFAITPPTFVYNAITQPLQQLASVLAEHMLELLGYSVIRQGNILEMVGERLEVAEACSGIKSLTTLGFFGIVSSYFLVPPMRWRVILVLSVIPITIGSNALRIVLAGVVAQYDPVLARSAFHGYTGYLFLGLAAAVFLCVQWVLRTHIVQPDRRMA
jgi:exosortase